MSTGWIIGWAIGAVVVVAVVALLLILIMKARKIGDQAANILAALDESRENTLALWEVDSVNRSLETTRSALRQARIAVAGGDE